VTVPVPIGCNFSGQLEGVPYTQTITFYQQKQQQLKIIYSWGERKCFTDEQNSINKCYEAKTILVNASLCGSKYFHPTNPKIASEQVAFLKAKDIQIDHQKASEPFPQ